eukprot:gene16995-8499_t
MDAVNEVSVRLLFFAKSRDIVGLHETHIDISSVVTGQELLRAIVTKFPGLHILRENLLLSCNQEYLESDQVVELAGGEEVAVIPPISGG